MQDLEKGIAVKFTYSVSNVEKRHRNLESNMKSLYPLSVYE